MLVKNLPKSFWDKTFENIQELIAYVYDNQIVTEIWELSEHEVTDVMRKKVLEAKKLEERDFVNL